jgi:hypothetical protein
MMMLWALAKATLALLVLFATIVLLRWEWIEAAAARCCAHEFTKLLRTRWSCSKLVLRRNSIEFRNVTVDNGPGTWSAPYSLRIERLKFTFRLVGFLSGLPELTCGHLRLGPLEFCFGFRVKECETIDMEGVTLYLEDAEDAEAEDSSTVIKQGVLRKQPDGPVGKTTAHLIVLDTHRLRLFEEGVSESQLAGVPAKQTLKLHQGSFVHSDDGDSPADPTRRVPGRGSQWSAASRRSSAGSSPLSESSSMGADGQPAAAPPVLASSASGGGSFRMIVGCGKKTAVLMASSRGERDEWVQAIGSAIAARKRRAGPADERHKWASNSEWIERFFATMDAQKTRRVHRAHQQRREWRRRWGVHGSGSSGVYDGSGVHEDDGSGGQEQEVARREQREDSREDDDVEEEVSSNSERRRELRTTLFADRHLPGKDFLARLRESVGEMQAEQADRLQSLVQQRARWLEVSKAKEGEDRMEGAILWMIGRITVQGFEVTLNQKQRLFLGEDGA